MVQGRWKVEHHAPLIIPHLPLPALQPGPTAAEVYVLQARPQAKGFTCIISLTLGLTLFPLFSALPW